MTDFVDDLKRVSTVYLEDRLKSLPSPCLEFQQVHEVVCVQERSAQL